MRRNKIIKMSGAYLGVIVGAAIVQIVLQGEIEHFINKLIIAVMGYIVLIAIGAIIVLVDKHK